MLWLMKLLFGVSIPVPEVPKLGRHTGAEDGQNETKELTEV